ncbi:MAG: (d)CMP kinase [Phycisphaerae bacterium]
MKTTVITIDGPAGSGKSTVSKQLAARLGFSFLDTGAMYRAVAWLSLSRGIDPADTGLVAEAMDEAEFVFVPRGASTLVNCNGVDITEAIRSLEVTANVRHIASSAELRGRLVEMQRSFAKSAGDIVTEGRDQGSVVFPDAAVKFYLDAPVSTRAARRARELEAKGEQVNIAEIEAAIVARDESDMNRETGPLVVPGGAVVIDTGELSIEQVVDLLEAETNKRI